tara:strand:- start:6440 stop:6925 length:486 start_codon:yes stop_codon:yes gene_type:complete
MEIIEKLKDVLKKFGILDLIQKYYVFIIIFCVIGFIIFIVVLYNVYKYLKMNYKKVENFTSNDDNSAKLIMFHVDWCPHCKKAIPDWNAFKNEYNDLKINNYKLKVTDFDVTEDTPENKKLVQKYNVKGYPTIILEKNNNIIECELKPNKTNLEDFVNENL